MDFSVCGILGQFCDANQTRKTVFCPNKRCQNKVYNMHQSEGNSQKKFLGYRTLKMAKITFQMVTPDFY